MKFFEWGKNKAPQPQTVLQQVKKTDPRNISQGQDRGMHTIPCKSSNIQKQQGIFEVDDDDDYLPRAKAGAKSSSGGTTNQNTDEKLQDTIRFVFSLEQEGLLAIGTVALEQVAAIRNTRNHQKQISDGFESCEDFEDEDHLPRSVNSTCELPLDHYASDVESEEETQVVDPTLYKGNRSPVAGSKPLVLLTALPRELRRTLDHANVDQEYYSSYFCGLFSSRKRSSGSEEAKRIGTQKKTAPGAQEDYQKFSTTPRKSLLNIGTNQAPSIEMLATLWRSSCLQSSARIAAERKTCSPRASQVLKGAASDGITSGEVLTSPVTLPLGPSDKKMRLPGWFSSDDYSPKVAEFKRRMHERIMGNADEERRDGENDGGHWIKNDSEYVVLEM